MSELQFYKRRRHINKKTKIKYLIIALIGIGVAALAVALTFAFGKMELMNDAGMQPTIEHSERLLVDRVSYAVFSPKKNDIIAFSTNKGERSNVYIRRVIGMPGDKIRIYDGQIYINGEKYEDSFTGEPIKNPGIADDEITVGADEYFVLGDNRNLSEDSRSEVIGNVSKNEIIGKVWFRSAPFNRMGLI